VSGSREDYNCDREVIALGRIGFFVALLAVLSVACGGGSGDALVAKLPSLMPEQSEVEEVASQWQLKEESYRTASWSNKEFAGSEGLSVQQVEDGGRIDGFLASFSGGPTPYYPMVMMNATLSVYRDGASADRALRKGPYWATGPSSEEYEFGDAAIAWPMSNVSHDWVTQEPSCPCQVWVRVGRLVGTVDVQFGGPPGVDRRESSEAVEIAREMAARMAAAQG
jgi:hypothetical protein